MKKINFDVMKYNKGFILENVEGQEIKINNIILGLYKNTEKTFEKIHKWFIIDLNSGLSINTGETQQIVINKVKQNFLKFMDYKIGKNYKDSVKTFEQLKIDSDKYYYIVHSVNNVNSSERKICETYLKANNYKISLTFKHTNIYIENVLK